MKAIVLTYDARRVVVDHMIYKYDELWPSHPFTFRVPYQSSKILECPLRNEKNVEYIKSSRYITATILTLLEGLDPDEWIYWCIDDYYPTMIDVPKIESTLKFLKNVNPSQADWISIARPKDIEISRETVHSNVILEGYNGNNYYLRTYPHNFLFWQHSFMRVKSLTEVFFTARRIFAVNTLENGASKAFLISDKRYCAHDYILHLSEATFRSRKNNKYTGKSSVICPELYESLMDNDFLIPDTLAIPGGGRSSDDTIYKDLIGRGFVLWMEFLRNLSFICRKIRIHT